MLCMPAEQVHAVNLTSFPLKKVDQIASQWEWCHYRITLSPLKYIDRGSVCVNMSTLTNMTTAGLKIPKYMVVLISVVPSYFRGSPKGTSHRSIKLPLSCNHMWVSVTAFSLTVFLLLVYVHHPHGFLLSLNQSHAFVPRSETPHSFIHSFN